MKGDGWEAQRCRCLLWSSEEEDREGTLEPMGLSPCPSSLWDERKPTEASSLECTVSNSPFVTELVAPVDTSLAQYTSGNLQRSKRSSRRDEVGPQASAAMSPRYPISCPSLSVNSESQGPPCSEQPH